MIGPEVTQGVIRAEGIRYLMIRPDVLMGVVRELPAGQVQAFLQAFERSAFRHSCDSFERYRASALFAANDFLRQTAEVAARLGWGIWTIEELRQGARAVTVRDSPFAAGCGPATYPVCTPICGVLRAIVRVGHGQEVEVKEIECAAQTGGSACRFHLA